MIVLLTKIKRVNINLSLNVLSFEQKMSNVSLILEHFSDLDGIDN